MFRLTIKSTSYQVFPGDEAIDLLQPLLSLMEYEDEYEDMIKTLGYVYDESTNILFLHKGVNIEYVQRLLGNVKITNKGFDKYDTMKFEYDELYPPRNDDQKDVIEFIGGTGAHIDNINDSQLFVVKDPGFGKTFCASVGMCTFNAKTLIITHRDSLRKQWFNSLYDKTGMSNKHVHEICSSAELYDIACNRHDFDYDVYLMTHATFRAGLKRIGSLKKAMNISKNLKIGMKIIDEAHLEFKDTILMDFVFNVARNIYLTATDGRSSKEENSIFRHVFSKATFYKKRSSDMKNTPTKWVEYSLIELNTQCPVFIYKYRVAGGRGMNPATYGKWVIQRDKKQTHFKCCVELLRDIFNKDHLSKVIVFMPLIDLCDEFAYFCNNQLNYDDSFDYEVNIKTINSKNTKSENEYNKRADVIVTTIGSCGTGTDIPGITAVISCSPFRSPITARQVFGRIRYCGKVCQYYDIYDASVLMDKIWAKSRAKTLKPYAYDMKKFITQ